MAQQMAALANFLQSIQIPPGVNPVPVNLPIPPKLEGALAPNDWLAKATKHAYNRVLGPDSMIVYRGYVYTGQADGWLVEISPTGIVRKLARLSLDSCGRPNAVEGACGRPTGMRLDNYGYIVVADAYNGIFQVNPINGRFKKLVDARTLRVNNQPLGYINDVAVATDGTIFFTSSSSKWSLSKENSIIFEAEKTGRVLFYNPRETKADKQVQELITKLSFPTGLQLAADNSYLLVGEGSLSRILRAWIGPGPKRGNLEVFASNLPGIVDNIRLSPRGTFWVGLSQSRHYDLPSVLDVYGDIPETRGKLVTLVINKVKFDNPKFGIVVELNGNGQIVRSLQDPTGRTFTGVSEVQEENGVLFFASPGKAFVGYIHLNSLDSPSVDQGGSGTGSLLNHPLMKELLYKVRRNMMRMSLLNVRKAALDLTKEVLRVRQISLYYQRLIRFREEALRRIQQSNNQQTTDGGPSSTTPSGTEPTTCCGNVTTSPAADTTTPSSTSTATSAGTADSTSTADATVTTADAGTTPSSTSTATSAGTADSTSTADATVTTTDAGVTPVSAQATPTAEQSTTTTADDTTATATATATSPDTTATTTPEPTTTTTISQTTTEEPTTTPDWD